MINLKSLLSAVFLMMTFQLLSAQSVIGTWKTIDDEDGKVKSHVEIYETNGTVYGKVVKQIDTSNTTICTQCKGDLKDAPIEGLTILYDMKGSGKKSQGGSILDPASGSEYNCKIELVSDDKLKVRGYIGMPLLGRTQYWYRVN